MEIINIKSLKIINEENQRLKQEKITQAKTIAELIKANKKKDMFAMQLAKTVAELNIKVNQLGGK